MSSFSDALEDNVLNHYFRNIASIGTATVHLSLHTTPGPSDTGGPNELAVANGYARQAITFGAASGGVISNTGAVSFTASGAAWGDIIAVGIWTASTAGTMLAWDGITTATVGDGDTINFAIGQISITLT